MSITRYRRALRPLAFDKVLALAGMPETLVTIPDGTHGVSIHLVVVSASARIGFDAVAGATSFRVSLLMTYDDEVLIRSFVSFVGDTALGQPRAYGIIWVE